MTDLSTWAEIDTERMLDEIEAAHGSTFFDSWARLDPARAVREIETELGVTLSPFDVLDPRSLVLRVESALSEGGGDEQTLLASLLAAGDSFHAPSSSASSTLTAGLVSDSDGFHAPSVAVPTFVQGKRVSNGNTSSPTVAATLDAAAQSGSAILVSVGFASDTGTVTGVTDNMGNTYEVLDTQPSDGQGYTWVTAVGFVSNAPSTITATMNASYTFATILVDEYSNLSAVRSHDSQVNATFSPPVAAVVGDIVYGSAVNISGSGISAGTGFTGHQNNVGGAFQTESKVADDDEVFAQFVSSSIAAVVVLH